MQNGSWSYPIINVIKTRLFLMTKKLLALQRQLNQLIQCQRGQKTFLANSKFGQLFMFYLVCQDFDLKLLFFCLVRKKNVCFLLQLNTRFFNKKPSKGFSSKSFLFYGEILVLKVSYRVFYLRNPNFDFLWKNLSLKAFLMQCYSVTPDLVLQDYHSH